MRRERFVVRHGQQLAVIVATDDAVQAIQLGGALLGFRCRGLELFARHVGRVKRCSGWLGPHALDERRITAETIPRAIVDLRETACLRIRDRAQQFLLVPVGLEPEGRVHFPTGLDEQLEHALLLRTQAAAVGGQSHLCVHTFRVPRAGLQ